MPLAMLNFERGECINRAVVKSRVVRLLPSLSYLFSALIALAGSVYSLGYHGQRIVSEAPTLPPRMRWSKGPGKPVGTP